MSFLKDPKPEIKLFLIVTAVAAVLTVGGILLLQAGLGPSSPPSATPSAQPQTFTDWRGTYTYAEFAPPNQTWVYTLDVSEDGGVLNANLSVDGFQTAIRFQATTQERNGNNLDVVFDSYGPQSTRGRFQKGDVLFTLKKLSESEYEILWDQLQSNLLDPGQAIFEKQPAIDTSTWQTYRNEEFGFEFQYDPGENVQSCTVLPLEEGSKSFSMGRIDVDIFEAKGLGLAEFVDQFIQEREDEFWKVQTRNSTTVADRQGEAITFRFGGLNRFEEASFIKRNDDIFVISFTAGGFVCNEPDAHAQILSTFRFVDSGYASLCKNSEFIPQIIFSRNFDESPEEKILFSCDKTSLSGFKSYLVDSEFNVLWEGFTYADAGLFSGPAPVDVDEDGVYEVFWSASSCGGTCTGCSISYYVYSLKYDEEFSRVESEKANEQCELVEQPTKFSPNLEEERFQEFKEFLQDQKAPTNIG